MNKSILIGNKDRLIIYNNKRYEYDEVGNPIIYKDKELVWEKGNLIRYDNVEYSFSSNGVRLSMKVGNVINHYYYY